MKIIYSYSTGVENLGFDIFLHAKLPIKGRIWLIGEKYIDGTKIYYNFLWSDNLLAVC